jgi:hypothetical protein
LFHDRRRRAARAALAALAAPRTTARSAPTVPAAALAVPAPGPVARSAGPPWRGPDGPHPGAYPRLTTHPAEQAGLRLAQHDDLGVRLGDPELVQRMFLGLFERAPGDLNPFHVFSVPFVFAWLSSGSAD